MTGVVLIIRAILAALLLSWLSACSLTGQGDTPAKVALAEGINYTLTGPPQALLGKSQSHLIEAAFAGKVRRFMAQVEYSEQQISLAAVSLSGLPLFDFIWRPDRPLVLNQYLPLPGLDIKYMIADIQWINWPLAQLEPSLGGDGVEVSQLWLDRDKPGGVNIGEAPKELLNWRRSVKKNGKLVLQVEKTGNHYLLEHVLREYSIKITSLGGEGK